MAAGGASSVRLWQQGGWVVGARSSMRTGAAGECERVVEKIGFSQKAHLSWQMGFERREEKQGPLALGWSYLIQGWEESHGLMLHHATVPHGIPQELWESFFTLTIADTAGEAMPEVSDLASAGEAVGGAFGWWGETGLGGGPLGSSSFSSSETGGSLVGTSASSGGGFGRGSKGIGGLLVCGEATGMPSNTGMSVERSMRFLFLRSTGLPLRMGFSSAIVVCNGAVLGFSCFLMGL
nr:retrotransposon protein [Paspalum simplex]